MKKFLYSVAAAVLLLVNLTACGAGSDGKRENTETVGASELCIVTSIFPEYDWVKNILGDQAENVDLTLLLDNGVDLHSYQPTAADILKVASCDLFIYVGGESDEWVDDVLKEAANKNMVVIDLLDVLGDAVKEEELVEGMQEEHEDGEKKGDGTVHGQEEETEYDEHVWLSLKNARTIVDYIAGKLAEIDPSNADSYRANASDYAKKLEELDKRFETAVNESSVKTILFGDRFPFRYLADDYGLDYYAAFVGCSAETEASFETVIFLAGKVNELGLKSILTIESSDQKIAKTIVENTRDKSQQILTMDSMQSVTAKDVKSGTTYLSLMEKNLEVLRQALANKQNRY